MAETNPNGANGTTSDPREQVMWDIYVTGIAKGKENAYEAAKKAGYEEATCKQITVRSWFIERKDKLRRKGMLSKAEQVLEKTLNYETENEEGKVDVPLLRVQTDVAKTVVQTLGKDEGYSSRSELTGKDGKDLPVPILHVLPNNSDEENTEANKEN